MLTRGGDQLPVSTKFDMRSDPQVIRNYGAWWAGGGLQLPHATHPARWLALLCMHLP